MSATGWATAPTLLTRIVRVLGQPSSEDDEGEKPLREMLEKKPDEFFAMYERQEGIARAGLGKKKSKEGEERPAESPPEAEDVVDEQTAGVEELIGRLIERWEGAGYKSRSRVPSEPIAG